MNKQLEALIAAAKKYRETLNAHRENPKDAGAVEAWDTATSELDALIKNNELDIIASLIAALESIKFNNKILSQELGLRQVVISDMTMMIKRLSHSLRCARPDSKLPDEAMRYLKKNGLISVGDILR